MSGHAYSTSACTRPGTVRDGAILKCLNSASRNLAELKGRVASIPNRFYSQDLFNHPYTRVEFVQRDLGVSRLTATKYLDTLAHDGVLEKLRVGRNNYYVNRPLFDLLGRGAG